MRHWAAFLVLTLGLICSPATGHGVEMPSPAYTDSVAWCDSQEAISADNYQTFALPGGDDIPTGISTREQRDELYTFIVLAESSVDQLKTNVRSITWVARLPDGTERDYVLGAVGLYALAESLAEDENPWQVGSAVYDSYNDELERLQSEIAAAILVHERVVNDNLDAYCTRLGQLIEVLQPTTGCSNEQQDQFALYAERQGNNPAVYEDVPGLGLTLIRGCESYVDCEAWLDAGGDDCAEVVTPPTCPDDKIDAYTDYLFSGGTLNCADWLAAGEPTRIGGGGSVNMAPTVTITAPDVNLINFGANLLVEAVVSDAEDAAADLVVSAILKPTGRPEEASRSLQVTGPSALGAVSVRIPGNVDPGGSETIENLAYSLEFKATDSEGLSASRRTTIRLQFRDTAPTVALPPLITAVNADSLEVVEGAGVSISVETDRGEGALTHLWFAGGGTFAAADQSATTWTAPNIGGTGSYGTRDYTLTITVTDSLGRAAQNSVTITVCKSAGCVEPPNTAPTVTITAPANTTIPPGGSLDISATITDPDDTSHTWTASGASPAQGSSSDGTIAVTVPGIPLPAGAQTGEVSDESFTLRITATDDSGASGSALLLLTRQRREPVPPVTPPVVIPDALSISSISATPSDVEEGASVSLSVSTSGGVLPLTYSWTMIGQTINNADQATAQVSAPTISARCQTFLAECRVTDFEGYGVSRSVSINVRDTGVAAGNCDCPSRLDPDCGDLYQNYQGYLTTCGLQRANGTDICEPLTGSAWLADGGNRTLCEVCTKPCSDPAVRARWEQYLIAQGINDASGLCVPINPCVVYDDCEAWYAVRGGEDCVLCPEFVHTPNFVTGVWEYTGGIETVLIDNARWPGDAFQYNQTQFSELGHTFIPSPLNGATNAVHLNSVVGNRTLIKTGPKSFKMEFVYDRDFQGEPGLAFLLYIRVLANIADDTDFVTETVAHEELSLSQAIHGRAELCIPAWEPVGENEQQAVLQVAERWLRARAAPFELITMPFFFDEQETAFKAADIMRIRVGNKYQLRVTDPDTDRKIDVEAICVNTLYQYDRTEGAKHICQFIKVADLDTSAVPVQPFRFGVSEFGGDDVFWDPAQEPLP